MKVVSGVVMVTAVLVGCGSGSEPVSSPEQFFEQSTRRDATVAERALVASVGGCTSFFIRNTAGKTLVGSARHCFDYSITNWCPRGKVYDNEGRTGTCKRIVAADANHDIAVFEAEMGYTPPAASTLRLSSYQPTVNTRLKMIGYPGDRYRNGRLTVTETCWVLYASSATPHRDSRLGDRSSLHNCTTYGGNSGGPMIHEGTDVVVGLPFTYMPNDYNPRSSTNLGTAAYLAQMADFVSVHRATLEAEGVEIVD